MARRVVRSLANVIMAGLNELAALSDDDGGINRPYLSRSHKAAAQLVADRMRAAGLDPRIDAAGTVVGRLEGQSPDAKTLLIGSHIDSVPNAGRFDGVLGVVTAIEALAELRRSGARLPYAVEVLAFGDGEGVRFGSIRLPTRTIAGTADRAMLEIEDADGVTVREALRKFGCDAAAIKGEARNAASILGYVEIHIEQGTELASESVPLGIVTAISGASRLKVCVAGKGGHAGTAAMGRRADALVAAAEMILAVESVGQAPGLSTTVGQILVEPGARNAVPSAATITVDIRSPVDRTRRTAVRDIVRRLKQIERRRQVGVEVAETYEQRAVPCDRRLIRHFSTAVENAGIVPHGLPSGVSHDGVAFAQHWPIGMLFVRCKGVSHGPGEHVRPDDIEVAARVLIDFLHAVSQNGRSIA